MIAVFLTPVPLGPRLTMYIKHIGVAFSIALISICFSFFFFNTYSLVYNSNSLFRYRLLAFPIHAMTLFASFSTCPIFEFVLYFVTTLQFSSFQSRPLKFCYITLLLLFYLLTLYIIIYSNILHHTTSVSSIQLYSRITSE